MNTYQIFIEDERSTVPTLRLLTVANHERARYFAQMALDEDVHHKGVEVYLHSLWVFGLGSLAGGRPEERPAAAQGTLRQV